MYRLKILTGSLILLMVLTAGVPFRPQAYANPAAISLFTVSNFAALAATAVSSPTAGTNLNGGDLGITGAGCTNFPVPCQTPGVGGVVIGGVIITPGGAATTGQTDATAVANALLSPTADLTLSDLNVTLDQGVYDITAAATNLAGGGVLTLTGDANSVFILRAASTLIFDSGSSVVVTGGARACNVFWRVGSSATFNGTTNFVGTVVAATDVTFPGGGAVLNGRAIAQTGAITFNNTTIINNGVCATVGGGGGGEEEISVGRLPNTGGAPIRADFPWSLVVVGVLSALALAFGVREYRRTHLPKQ